VRSLAHGHGVEALAVDEEALELQGGRGVAGALVPALARLAVAAKVVQVLSACSTWGEGRVHCTDEDDKAP
jgi:hypothetical protein